MRTTLRAAAWVAAALCAAGMFAGCGEPPSDKDRDALMQQQEETHERTQEEIRRAQQNH